MEKERKYRILEESFYDKGEIRSDYTRYFVQVQKSLLWYKYWSSIKQPSYDGGETVFFKTLDDAQKFVEKLKENKKFWGWKERVVWGDSEFKKIN